MLIGEIKNIGKRKYLIQGQGKSVWEALQDYQKASFYDVPKCGVCNSDNLILRSRIAGDEEFEFSEVKCLDCKAALTITQAKKTKEFYLRKNKETGNLDWQSYTPKT